MDNTLYENFLAHIGVKYKSGRYEYGSGENPYQHDPHHVLKRARELKDAGMDEKTIANELGLTTTSLRANIAIADKEERMSKINQAIKLKEKGMSNVAIGERMGINESSVRALLNPSYQARTKALTATADALKEEMKNKKYLDIGKGSNIALNVTEDKLKKAVEMLKVDGYQVMYLSVKQGGTGHNTSVKVLVPPGTDYKTLYANQDKIKTIGDTYVSQKENGDPIIRKIKPPVSVSSDRVKIKYYEDGGIDKDGVIEIRRGLKDLDLGESRYAQVRIAVDGTHYLKGMCMYSDDLPKGVDIQFNTNKHKGTPKMDVLKKMKDDPDNPFGATITRQNYYIDKDGNDTQGALNIVNEEGSWGKWSKNLASQMLSKQTTSLAKKQLDLKYDSMEDEYEKLVSLTNPVVKKKLLETFADNCDASAVHLKAAAMPRQASHVILPFDDIKDTEIYAPNYRNGEKVVLIRYPHGGRFEIPELVVNNSSKQSADRLIHNAKDAVGISARVAERLSGADFDGDTVLVIPNNTGAIKTAKPLEGLEGFDPKERYPHYEGMTRMTPEQKQAQMGKASNLITDMTIKGATPDELARAVRYSMVVIDAEKHYLNYKAAYEDNQIAELKKKYQGGVRAGASTLISRAKSPEYVPERKSRYNINPETGEKEYIETHAVTYKPKYDKEGNIVAWDEKKKTTKSTKMAEHDPHELSSGTPMEEVYANYASRIKELGNRARKEYINTPSMVKHPEMAKEYATEVDSLNNKLLKAQSNAPRERQAQILMNQKLSAYKESHPDADKDDIKKATGQYLREARAITGASKDQIYITDKEWLAIQKGAITTNKLKEILNNADLDRVRDLATPKTITGMTTNEISRAKKMLENGYPQSEIADALGVSIATLRDNNIV